MPARFTELVVDCEDPEVLAHFWEQVLGWPRGEETDEDDDDDVEIELRNPDGYPSLLFGKVPDGKAVKNRLHIDLSPKGCDQPEELERLIALGARKIDIGQGDKSWVVLADPEGNEFCLLRTRSD